MTQFLRSDKVSENRKYLKYILFFSVLILLTFFSTGCEKVQSNETVQSHLITSVDDLTDKNIGVQIGTIGDIYTYDYEGDDTGTRITRFNKGADAIQALKQNKIDYVVIDEQSAKAFINKNKELAVLEEEFTIEDYAICISKENYVRLICWSTRIRELLF